MDISNLSSIIEVFFGVNLASSLIDNFNTLLFKHLIGAIKSESVLNYLKDSNSKYERLLKKEKKYQGFSRYTDFLENFYKSQIGLLSNTKYFDDCSFMKTMFCGSLLVQIAIDGNFDTSKINLFLILGALLLLIDFISILLEEINKDKISTNNPIVIPLIIFVCLFFTSSYTSDKILSSGLGLRELSINNYVYFLTFIAVSHFVLYFIRFKVKVALFNFSSKVTLKQMEKTITAFEKSFRGRLKLAMIQQEEIIEQNKISDLESEE